MNAVVFVNGTITDADRASVAVFDHGFLFGEGIYETLRTYGREPFLFDRHLRRLRHSASLLALDVPWSDADLLADVRKTMAAQPGSRALQALKKRTSAFWSRAASAI